VIQEMLSILKVMEKEGYVKEGQEVFNLLIETKDGKNISLNDF
jgi:ribosomal protein S8